MLKCAKILIYEIFLVEITERADRDLRNIFVCIVVDLWSFENAKKQAEHLWSQIRPPSKYSRRYRLYDKDPWHSCGLYILFADNYIVLYIPYLES